jgi:ribose 5-phosphate isomerase A
VLTDNGHPMLDVHGLHIDDPPAMESRDQPVAGCGDGGPVCRHRASVCLLGTAQGVQTLQFP